MQNVAEHIGNIMSPNPVTQSPAKPHGALRRVLAWALLTREHRGSFTDEQVAVKALGKRGASRWRRTEH